VSAIRSACLAALVLAAVPRPAAADTGFDLMVALDNSGSMKAVDPARRVPEIVGTFLQRLPGGARAGLVVFDAGSRRELPLTPAGSPAFIELVHSALSKVDYRGALTDIPGAVESCAFELSPPGASLGAQAALRRRGVVLITDGRVDVGNPAKDSERASWLRGEIAQAAARDRTQIFGVGITRTADYELLQSLKATTRAEYYKVEELNELAPDLDAIVRILEKPIPAISENPHEVPPPPPPSRRSLYFCVAAAALLAGVWWWRLRPGAPLPVKAWLKDRAGVTGADRIPITRRAFRIGRSPVYNDLAIDDPHVSARHAVVSYPWWGFGRFYLCDLKSDNGTFVNGEEIGNPDRVTRRLVNPGDSIRLDCHEFDLIAPAAARPGGTAGAKDGMTFQRAPSPKRPASPPAAPPNAAGDPWRTVPPGPPFQGNDEPTLKKADGDGAPKP
jgi:Mg-chelatase subunit ChlD